MGYSSKYIIGFAGAVCLVCAVIVSGAAVALKDRQEANKVLDRQKKVLSVAGLLSAGEDLNREAIQDRFKERIRPRIIDLKSGQYDETVALDSFDQRKATKDPALSKAAPKNDGKIARVPKNALIYQLMAEGNPEEVEMLILPIVGKGLWSTMYGFLALAPDTTTIQGLTFYEHGETPGLGGEVENPSWLAKWVGRKVYDENWVARINVKKGLAQDPKYDVDGLSGATLTCRGVSGLIQFWLGENGYSPFLAQFRKGGPKS